MIQAVEKPFEQIFIAIDTTDLGHAEALAKMLAGQVGGAKLGKEFFTAHGPAGVQRIAQHGLPIFLDLKFHDIPNTVAGAIRASLPLGPAIVNVHASGGSTMMNAAVRAGQEAGEDRPMIIAVTILTSLGDEDLNELGLHMTAKDQVVRLAKLAQAAGMDGVVCSPREIEAIRAACGPQFKLVVPGIRPIWAATGDQKRIMTPKEAVDAGADYLVIGRPITQAANPVEAARKIAEELAD